MKSNRAAAEIMYAYAAEDAARGRNDECSCGSGRKFKRCHGDRPLPSKAAIDAAVRRIMSKLAPRHRSDERWAAWVGCGQMPPLTMMLCPVT